MRPREQLRGGEEDLFRSRLDQISDLKHPLVRLGGVVDWQLIAAGGNSIEGAGPKKTARGRKKRA